MTAKKNVVRISILNEEYTIRSDAAPEHTRAVAAYVDSTIRRVLDTGSVVETNRAAILAALQIAGELFEAREGGDVTKQLQGLSAEIRRLLPPAKRGEPAA
jgi:cell division protein ZapA